MPFFSLPPSGSITPDWSKALRLRLDQDDDDNQTERALRMEIEKRAEREMRRALDEMLNTLFPEGYGDFVDPQLEASRIHQAFLRDQTLQDTISRAIQDSADLGVSVAVNQLAGVGYGFDWTLANTRAREWANRHTATVLEQLGTTSGRLAGQTVARWINNNEPFPALIRDLEPVFGRRRSEMIAATEVTRAFAHGNIEGYKESGIVTKMIWRTANDERVCIFCGSLHERVVGIHESFDSKLPKDLLGKVKPFVAPPAHPGCRCIVIAEVEEPKRRRTRG